MAGQVRERRWKQCVSGHVEHSENSNAEEWSGCREGGCESQAVVTEFPESSAPAAQDIFCCFVSRLCAFVLSIFCLALPSLLLPAAVERKAHTVDSSAVACSGDLAVLSMPSEMHAFSSMAVDDVTAEQGFGLSRCKAITDSGPLADDPKLAGSGSGTTWLRCGDDEDTVLSSSSIFSLLSGLGRLGASPSASQSSSQCRFVPLLVFRGVPLLVSRGDEESSVCS